MDNFMSGCLGFTIGLICTAIYAETQVFPPRVEQAVTCAVEWDNAVTATDSLNVVREYSFCELPEND